MGGKAKRPQKTPEEQALLRLQIAELSRSGQDIAERRRRIIRGQLGGRSSLLSGSERGIRTGEARLSAGSPSALAGQTGGVVGSSAGLGGFARGAGGGRGGRLRGVIP